MSGEKSPSINAGSPAPNAAQIRSRRNLLLVFSFIFVVWVGMMLVLYFGTVYPHRHPATLPMSNLTVGPGGAS